MGQQAAAATEAAAGNVPLQQQGFDYIQAAQGLAQPYFAAGSQYLQGSALPITYSDVANYYNPMAQNVTAQMQNIFGSQMRDITGSLTKAAGGIGADRIAVGQSELANQQGLAAGQTYAGLYLQALQAAEMQKQMMAGAGYGIAQMGPAAQQSAISGISAAQAYPYMAPQAEAGIASQLMAPLGYGQTTSTTQPSPSPLSQALGIGTSLFGLGMKGMGSGGGLGTGGMGYNPYGPSGIYRRGGKVMADGGRTGAPLYGEILPPMSHTYPRMPFPLGRISEGGAVMPFHAGQGFADGGMPMVPLDALPANAQLPQSFMTKAPPPSWTAFQAQLPALPAANWMQLAQQSAPPVAMAFPPSQPVGSVNPMLAARQQTFDQQPDLFPKPDPNAGWADGGRANHYQDGGGDESFDDRWGDFPSPGEMDPNALGYGTMALAKKAVPGILSGNEPPSGYAAQSPTDDTTSSISARRALPAPGGQLPLPTTTGSIDPNDIGRYDLPPSRTPYPDALQRDWGQRATRSPWMALVRAGAKMAQTRGPIGSVIGAGLGEYADTLGGERKSLIGEEAINQKAQSLFQQAREHLDLYAKGNFKVVGIGSDGQPILMEQKSGQMVKSPTPFAPLQGGTAIQRDVEWMLANKIAPDRATAFQIRHTGVNSAAQYNRAVEAAKSTIIKAGLPFSSSDDLEQQARALAESRGLKPPPLTAPSPATRGAISRPASVPPDAGYSPSTGKWYSRVQNKSWDASGAEVP